MKLRLCLSVFLGLAAALLLAPSPVLAQGAAISLGQPQTDPDAPLEVTADALTVERETGTAIFLGNVRAEQGGMTLNADEVRVFYEEASDTTDPEDEGIREIIAIGNVIMVNGPDIAEAERAVYRPRTDQVVMTGNVLLTQGRTIISGERMVVNLVTGQGTVEGRVRTLLRQGGEASE